MCKIRHIWSRQHGQGLVEYSVILAFILMLVLGAVHLVGVHSKDNFSRVVRVFQPEQNGD